MTTEEKKQLLFVGLGNPGKQYENTRHNVGFVVLRALADLLEISFSEEKRFQSEVGKKGVQGSTVHLLLPLTYMNHSGMAVRKYLDYYKLGYEQLVVVVDDVDLPFGKFRFRSEGGAGGHRGLESIQKHLGSRNYSRLRIGIGAPSALQRSRDGEEALSNFVLGRFTQEENEKLVPLLKECVGVLSQMVPMKQDNQNKPLELGQENGK